MRTVRNDCDFWFSECWWYEITCTNQSPAVRIPMPDRTPIVSTRRWGSPFFNWSKINILNAPSFYFTIRPKAGLAERAVNQSIAQPAEDSEPERCHQPTYDGHDEKL